MRYKEAEPKQPWNKKTKGQKLQEELRMEGGGEGERRGDWFTGKKSWVNVVVMT